MTWDRRLYFPSEGRRATASAGFEPANLGTKGQHATSRPPKPIIIILILINEVYTSNSDTVTITTMNNDNDNDNNNNGYNSGRLERK